VLAGLDLDIATGQEKVFLEKIMIVLQADL